MYLSIYLSMYLSNYLSIYLSIYRSIYLSIFLLSIYLPSIYLSICKIKNEEILWDFLIFRSSRHQKGKNSARLPSKMESWVQSWQTASYQCVLRFFQSTCLKYCACHEKVMPGHTKCCTCHAKSSQQTWKSEDPKCNPSQESAPGLPNSSDEHVSCTAPATENASLQILFKCPMPAIVFGNATKPSRFAHFWKGAESLAPATRNDIWTSKSGPNP